MKQSCVCFPLYVRRAAAKCFEIRQICAAVASVGRKHCLLLSPSSAVQDPPCCLAFSLSLTP